MSFAKFALGKDILNIENRDINGKIRNKTLYELVKRFFDITLCILASAIVLPVIFISCICVVLESRGSPIYIQERLGLNGKYFNIYKIRSMRIDAEKYTGPKCTDENDSRITRIGKVIRRMKVDELPQIINIIKGDMSIVGPRPERPYFANEYEKVWPNFKSRLQVVPGLTGLAQVNGGYSLTPGQKLEWDLKYIEIRSMKTDIYIILKTIIILFNGCGLR